MTLRSLVITFDGGIQSLATLLDAGVLDVAVSAIDIQADAANANPFYVGDSAVTVSSGIKVPTPLDGIPEPPYRIGDFSDGDMRMGDAYVKGTSGEKARILVFA